LGVNAEHLDYFKFIDRVLILTVFHHWFLNTYFVSGFYIFNREMNLKDLEAINYELYKGLTWILCMFIVTVVVMLLADASVTGRTI